jgi:hypothetical protein
LIFKYLEFYERERCKDANTASLTEARGWSGLYNGFIKDAGDKVSAIDFVPYPKLVQQDNRKISVRTVKVIAKLVNSGRLPSKVIAGALQLVEVREELGYENS